MMQCVNFQLFAVAIKKCEMFLINLTVLNTCHEKSVVSSFSIPVLKREKKQEAVCNRVAILYNRASKLDAHVPK